MVAARRLGWSPALDRAVQLALELGRPLLIFEPLDVDYRWSAHRHHVAILEGMAEHRARLARSVVGYYPYVEPAPGRGKGLLAALAERACVVVTDDAPVFFTPRLLAAASRLRTRVEAVDGCGLLPIRAADRSFTAAHHFRRFLHKTLPEHLGAAPSRDPLDGLVLPPCGGAPRDVVDRWPSAGDGLLGSGGEGVPRDSESLRELPIDHSVRATDWRGGSAAARRRLARFIETGLSRYAEERNDPDSGASSGLSPWLHHGQLSVHEVFDAIVRHEGWSPARLNPPHDGRRRGWWGMSAGAEAFLDELITWRELGYGYCAHHPDYDRYETLPEWALETLEAHATDPRAHTYSLDELAAAATHDELWNAAQRQLLGEGVIHNYLRMLWGKKILAWTEHPRIALAAMIELNNRYSLDGRDPNSYTGIMWILGRFDRGWPERPIFGKVRSMTSESTRRKVRLDHYLDRWGPRGRP
jgi:deoxyribodipyrimidine photo-lyase